MSNDDQELENILKSQLLRLSARAHGVAAGLVLALLIFVATNWLVLKGGDVVGPNLALLGQYFPGYEVTFAGSILGAVYGFITGFLLGYLVAYVYNRLAARREAPR